MRENCILYENISKYELFQSTVFYMKIAVRKDVA